jgi:hypothetical protein|tara:strand:+ start:237 stop:449 length:213 start_codon:yes stop_codon:yes gene_type:complete
VKFVLTISLCSFINNQCLPPAEVKQEFNSWKECTIAALEISKQIIIAQEDTFVNKKKIATKFMCKPTSAI